MKGIYLYKRQFIIIIVMTASMIFTGCKKFIEVEPPVTSINQGNVYQEDATAASALTGIYTKMANQSFSRDLTVYLELSGDNLALFNTGYANYTAYYTNSLLASDGTLIPKLWMTIYPYVFNTNAAIEGLTASTTLTSVVKQNLLGEAYFLRAFYYYYLVNLYGDVPLALTTDYTVNNKLTRTPADQVYAQIIDDLKKAHSMLGESYLKGDALTAYAANSEERFRPNKSVAAALLARVYLHRGEWANAEQTATDLIGKTTQFNIVPLDQVFLKNNRETIWAFPIVKGNQNTDEGEFFTLRPGGPSTTTGKVVYLAPKFVSSFQPGDQRQVKWIGTQTGAGGVVYPYAAKYKAIFGATSITENTVILRLAEQYLIRAEARIQQNKIAEAVADLNVLRDRAIDKSEPDPDKRLKLLEINLSKEQGMAALMYERRVELFCEWGHRWLDLKRTGLVDAAMLQVSTDKGSDWKSYKSLYPVPSDEIRINGRLSQNTGYTN